MSLPNRRSRSHRIEHRGPRDAARATLLSFAICSALVAIASPAAAQEALPPPPPVAPLRLRDRLEIAGGVLFGVGFLPAAVAGAVMPVVVDQGSPLRQWYPIEAAPIPVAGPALYAVSLLTAPGCHAADSGCQAVAGLFLADAVLQLAGAVIMVAGPLVDHDPPHATPPPVTATVDRRVRWTVGFGTATAPLGLSIRIAHF